jgi:hypothetical protein
MSTQLARFARTFIVGAGEVKIFNACSQAQITSGSLTVCTFVIGRVRPKGQTSSYYLFAHVSDSCTFRSLEKNYKHALHEKGIGAAEVEIVAIRTAPDTQVRSGKNYGVDTTEAAYHFADSVSGQGFQHMYGVTAQATGRGPFINECVVDIPGQNRAISVGRKQGVIDKIAAWWKDAV